MQSISTTTAGTDLRVTQYCSTFAGTLTGPVAPLLVQYICPLGPHPILSTIHEPPPRPRRSTNRGAYWLLSGQAQVYIDLLFTHSTLLSSHSTTTHTHLLSLPLLTTSILHLAVILFICLNTQVEVLELVHSAENMIFPTKLSWAMLAASFALQSGCSPAARKATVTTAAIPATTAVGANPYETASGGALDPSPLFTVATTFAAAPGTLTIQVVNIAINDARFALGGEASLIEGSFKPQLGSSTPVGCIDVSYIAGFSFPVVCTCFSDNNFLSGCDKNLFQLGTCPPGDLVSGVCKNPRRGNKELKEPTDFFRPCRGKAYTYEDDHDALSNGKCQSGTMRCVILPNGR